MSQRTHDPRCGAGAARRGGGELPRVGGRRAPTALPPGHRESLNGGRAGGAIIIVALLALVLMACLVFYVFNVGRHVAGRVEAQNAADSAAMSGASWVARSFNTVAMNNVETARLISLAAVLDTLPQAVDYTLIDQRAFAQGVADQLTRGVGRDEWLEAPLAEAGRTFERHLELLGPLDEVLNGGGYDIARMTHYTDSEGQRGSIWQAIESMSAVSQAAMLELPLQSQHSAFRGAQISQREAGKSSGGLLLPWLPEVPWDMGAFDDFRDPVVDGLLPSDDDNKVTNRGPYDTVFGMWQRRSTPTTRDLDIEVEQDFAQRDWVPQPPNTEVVEREIISYSTVGAFTEMQANLLDLGAPRGSVGNYQRALDSPGDAEAHPLVPSLWARRVQFISDHKINDAFPGAAAQRQVLRPRWITNYDDALSIQSEAAADLAYGMFLVFDFTRNEYEGQALGEPVLSEWGLLRRRGGPDVLRPTEDKVADHIWRDQRIERTRDLGGRPYRRRTVRYYVFLAVNVGEPVSIRNPYNFDSGARADLPGPINFDQTQVLPSDESRRETLTFLGIAHQPKDASFWPAAFDRGRVDPKLVTVAQAEVFNNHSWDLWTQMWHAQLVPVDDFGGWMEQLADPPDLEAMDWLETDDVASVVDYLDAVAPLADVMLEH